MTTTDLLASSMSEAQLQQNVIEMAHALGWLVHAERPAVTGKGWRTPVQGDKGFPDLVLVSRNWMFIVKQVRVIFAELKSESGQVSKEQGEWQERLGCRPFYYLWRPSDWLSGRIEKVLRQDE